MVAVMAQLGFSRFAIAGHDRGGRVVYRLALDHPERVDRLAVFDVLPVAEMWERADARFANAFWPWSLLAQPAPLPERLVSAAPDAVIDNGDWLKIGGQAASAIGGNVSFAGWNFCP
jgi:haloacetate dehalogenase